MTYIFIYSIGDLKHCDIYSQSLGLASRVSYLLFIDFTAIFIITAFKY